MINKYINKSWLISRGYAEAIPGSQTLAKKTGRMEIYLHPVMVDGELFWEVKVRFVYRVNGNNVGYLPLTQELAKYRQTLVKMEEEFGV